MSDERDTVVGTWGRGPFENDDARDFIVDLTEGSEPVEDGLLEALDLPVDDYIEAPEGAIAVAAAAVVAAAAGHAPVDPAVAELLAQHPFVVSDALKLRARSALVRALGEDSEWAELWEDAGELDDLEADVQKLHQGLRP